MLVATLGAGWLMMKSVRRELILETSGLGEKRVAMGTGDSACLAEVSGAWIFACVFWILLGRIVSETCSAIANDCCGDVTVSSGKDGVSSSRVAES